jgi:PIN domain nuclease of toxin-antitoxin system
MPVKSKALLDTSCLIALADKEHGWEFVRDIRKNSGVSLINLSEFVSVIAKRGATSYDIKAMVSTLAVESIQLTADIAFLAGELIVHTKKFGLSLGDRVCIATGILCDIPIYTADQIWTKLDLDCDIRLIR